MPIWHRRLTEQIDRQVGNPGIAALYRRWMDHRPPDGSLPPAASFAPAALADWEDDLMRLVELPGDFRYEHYGAGIVRHAGFDMTGRLVSSFGGELADFFLSAYRDCLERAVPLYTVHYTDRARNVFTWERLLLPAVDDTRRRWLIVYNRPVQTRIDLLQQVLNASDDALLALQPLLDESGQVLEWRVLMLNDAMAALVGLARADAAGQRADDVLLRWPQLGLDAPARALVRNDGTGPDRVDLELRLNVASQLRLFRVHLRRIADGCVIRLTEVAPVRSDLQGSAMPGTAATAAPASGFATALLHPATAAAVAPPAPLPDPPPATAEATGPRVLVAEDDAVNQLVLRRQLELLGCRVHLSADGGAALDAWQQAKDTDDGFELVFTDLHMPRLDGLALARALRTRELAQLCRRTPLIAVTGNADGDEARAALQAGVDAVLAKPVQLPQLRSLLDRWLARTAPAVGGLDSLTGGHDELDLGVLRQLLADDESAVRELLADYRQSALHLSQEMRQAFQLGDASQLAAIAHKLKSASNAVGARALAALCVQLERRQIMSDPEAVSTTRELFEQALAAVLSRIDAHLQNPP
jgi:CheY-like chemotaxis protein/HPt (histidine-containing phosphotransfer) domain-containing protein/PAS domain-containing protein